MALYMTMEVQKTFYVRILEDIILEFSDLAYTSTKKHTLMFR